MNQVDTMVLVKNLEESKAFYIDVLQLEILHDWGSMVIFKNRLALHQLDLLQPQELLKPYLDEMSLGSSNLIIYLGTQNLEDEYTRLLAKGVQMIHGIVDLPWQRVLPRSTVLGVKL